MINVYKGEVLNAEEKVRVWTAELYWAWGLRWGFVRVSALSPQPL